MGLFEECREALGGDFELVEKENYKNIVSILYGYPFFSVGMNWSKVKFIDYENIYELMQSGLVVSGVFYVFSDDEGVPVFRTTLASIVRHIDDVTALSPRMFIFNESVMLQPLFPTEAIRLGFKS